MELSGHIQAQEVASCGPMFITQALTTRQADGSWSSSFPVNERLQVTWLNTQGAVFQNVQGLYSAGREVIWDGEHRGRTSPSYRTWQLLSGDFGDRANPHPVIFHFVFINVRWLYIVCRILNGNIFHCRSRWSACLGRVYVVAHLLVLRVRIPPVAWMSISCECCVSGRGLCDGPIPRPEESYRMCVCVDECDRKATIMGRPWPTWDCCVMWENPAIKCNGHVST